MLVKAPISAARVPFRVNDKEIPDGVPAVAIQKAIQAWPGRVFLSVGGRSLVALGARELAGRVQILTGPHRGQREQWRTVTDDREESHLYAR